MSECVACAECVAERVPVGVRMTDRVLVVVRAPEDETEGEREPVRECDSEGVSV